MDYQEYQPPDALVGIVRCFWTLMAPPDERSPEPALPDGSPEFIVNLGDDFLASPTRGAPPIVQPRAMLVGQISAPLAVAPSGVVDLVAARFMPAGAAALYRPMSALTDRWLGAEGLPPRLAELPRTLRKVRGTAERLDHLAAACVAATHVGRPADARVVQAVARIEASDGAVSIASLAMELGTTPRNLQRLFGQDVGISPKALCRIRRFQRVFAAWRNDPGSWAEVAVRCGYFDQAHLARDVTELGGAAPAGLLAALPEFTRAFTALGPARPAQDSGRQRSSRSTPRPPFTS